MGAMGIRSPENLQPWHIMRRISPTEVYHYGEIYDFLEDGELLREPLPPTYARAMQAASPDTFDHVPGELTMAG
ncbi:MAG: hypothetical protein KDE51_02400, partial [Anaerolineales bacterium]|nr:hypothetical protein [Anaerolineales bacterium]